MFFSFKRIDKNEKSTKSLSAPQFNRHRVILYVIILYCDVQWRTLRPRVRKGWVFYFFNFSATLSGRQLRFIFHEESLWTRTHSPPLPPTLQTIQTNSLIRYNSIKIYNTTAAMSYTGRLGRKNTTGCIAAIIIRYIVRVCFRQRDYLYPTYFLLFYRPTTPRIKRFNRSLRIGTQYTIHTTLPLLVSHSTR